MPPKIRKLNLKTQTKTNKLTPLFPSLPKHLVSVICDFDKSIKLILKESSEKHKKTSKVDFSFPRLPANLNLPSRDFSLPDEFQQLLQHKESESKYKVYKYIIHLHISIWNFYQFHILINLIILY